MRQLCRRAKAAVLQCERPSAALVHRRAASEPGGSRRTIEECSRDAQAAYDSIVPQAGETRIQIREFRIQNSEFRIQNSEWGRPAAEIATALACPRIACRSI